MAGGIDFKAVADAMPAEKFARHEMQMRGNRAKCPWCDNPQHYNLAFYAADGKAHCHKCGRTADVVGLAAAVWHTNQLDAARQLNDVYRLGVAAETMTQAERDRREQARREARELRENAKRQQNAEYSAACDEVRAAQAAVERFTQTDAYRAEFNQALKRLCEAQQRCDVLQAAWAGGYGQ